jgi:hypothetical protein
VRARAFKIVGQTPGLLQSARCNLCQNFKLGQNASNLCRAIVLHLGGGATTYPLPLSTNPSEPEETTQFLNACPLCGLWYKCYNHLSFICGHKYHPWCAVHQLKNSSSCLVTFCDGIATVEWQAALGIIQGG